MNMPTRGQRTAKNKMKKVMGEYKEQYQIDKDFIIQQ